MNAIVLLFRDKNRASAHGAVTANGINTSNAPVSRALAWPKKPARDTLACIWRINRASGRPECRWSLVQTEAADGGGDCPGLLRPAA